MAKKGSNKKSFKRMLIGGFIFTSIIPTILISIFSYYHSSNIVIENVDELTAINLQQTKSSLDVWLESYSDILFQIYTDDEIVELVDKINRLDDFSATKNKLRHILRGLFYTKEYIKSITILTDNGTVVFYDQLTASNTVNSWMNTFAMSQEQLYDDISADNGTHIYSTQKAATFASETYYLFHLGHRIIDYKDVDKKSGVVIVSIDEKMLKNACTSEDNVKDISSFNFIVDSKGDIVSYIDSKQLSKKIVDEGLTEQEKKAAYKAFVNRNSNFEGEYTSIHTCYDEKFDWNIINVSNQSKIIEKLNTQQRISVYTVILSLLAIALLIALLTNRLTGSIQKVLLTMKKAGAGELSARVTVEPKMPIEVETIANQFNNMLNKVEVSIENEKRANEKERDAEIKALEAQINPHFLYNTLDTINWMAINQDEYEISNAINALATILRYSIDTINGIVTVREEIEWLKTYIFLQQTRLKHTFLCDIHIEPEILGLEIHKLLLQPFVENAIIHGFEGVNKTHKLVIEMKEQEESIIIHLSDNGKGIEKELLQEIKQGIFKGTDDKNYIGMENAITRIQMYYGSKSYVHVESCVGKGTDIIIKIPKKMKKS